MCLKCNQITLRNGQKTFIKVAFIKVLHQKFSQNFTQEKKGGVKTDKGPKLNLPIYALMYLTC